MHVTSIQEGKRVLRRHRTVFLRWSRELPEIVGRLKTIYIFFTPNGSGMAINQTDKHGKAIFILIVVKQVDYVLIN